MTQAERRKWLQGVGGLLFMLLWAAAWRIHVRHQDIVSENDLLIAVITHKPESVRKLLAEGANPNVRFSTGPSWSFKEQTRYVFGTEGLGSGKGRSILMVASVCENVEVERVLIEAGAEVNARDEYGATPLLCAAYHGKGSGPIILLLAAHGAELNAHTKAGADAWKLAQGNPNALQALEQAKRSVHTR